MQKIRHDHEKRVIQIKTDTNFHLITRSKGLTPLIFNRIHKSLKSPQISIFFWFTLLHEIFATRLLRDSDVLIFRDTYIYFFLRQLTITLMRVT